MTLSSKSSVDVKKPGDLSRRLTPETLTAEETVMTREKLLCTATSLVVVIVLLGAELAAQDKPDFSGSWTLESTLSAAEIPRTLSVTQSIVRTNVRGEPTEPFFKDITVTRALVSGTRSDTYEIGLVGGTVSGPGNGIVNGSRTYQRVVWEEQALVIESGTGPAPQSGWADRREVWTLDSNARLRLTITTSTSVDAPRTIVLVYRRQ